MKDLTDDERAASTVYRLYQAQHRYGLTDLSERAKHPKTSQDVRDLSKLSLDELLEQQRTMLRDQYPGKVG